MRAASCLELVKRRAPVHEGTSRVQKHAMPIIMDVFQMVAGQDGSACSGSPFVALLVVPLRV